MISYEPFRILLVKKHIQSTILMRELNISSATMAKLTSKKKSNKSVNLSTIEKICERFNCRISEVVEIINDDTEG